jgi:hypothetical protein
MRSLHRLAHDNPPMRERIRTEAGGVNLAVLGTLIPNPKVVGMKACTDSAGQCRRRTWAGLACRRLDKTNSIAQ